MKKLKLLILLGMILVAAITFQIRNSNSDYSDIELENIEALATNEEMSDINNCINLGSVKCYSGGYTKMNVWGIIKTF